MIKRLLETKVGQILLSIILGLGLAALFRQACKGNECLIVNGPKVNDVRKYFYKIDDDCFKYTPYATKCDHETKDSNDTDQEMTKLNLDL